MREPTWTEVDGVPVVWTELPGPLRAVLQFRVGVAHETASTHGVTHLVEHLALHGMHDRPYSLNGSTSLTRTSFVASGRPDEVAEFLASVAASLRALPAGRVEVERKVLLAEGDRRASSYREGLLFWRYGAREHGLAGMDEHGLRWLDAETVQAWADERFTRPNALLLLTGPPPPGLRLPLGDGPVTEPVRQRPVESAVPGWSSAAAGGLAAAGVVPRAPGVTVAMGVIGAELNRVLRFERGVTYAVEAVYEPLDADHAHFTVSADAPEADRPALRDAFLEELERLAAAGPDEAAVERVRSMALRMEDDDRRANALELISSAHATGRPYELTESVEAGISATTRDDVTELIRVFAGSALFMAPEGVDLPERYPKLPWGTGTPVRGVTFAANEGDARLIVGDEGVTLRVEESVVTVRWADLVATFEWEDGTTSYLGADAHRVTFVPWEWHKGSEARQRLGNVAPRRGVVPMGAQSPWGPPPPPRRPVAPALAPGRSSVRPWLLWVAVVLGAFIGVAQLTAAAQGPQPATPASEEFTSGDVLFLAVMGTLILTASAWGAWRLLRRRNPN